MRFVRGLVETYRHEHDGYPANLESLRTYVTGVDPRLAEFLAKASSDAWGNTLQYALVAAPAGGGAGDGYSLVSLGSDGRTGGEGEAADLDLKGEAAPDPMMLSREDGLQSQLADALGLEFQLEAMDYGQPAWRCSDMTVDEVGRRLQAKGLDFDVLGGTLAGSSLSAKAIKLLLGLMKLADSFMEGAIADTFKVVMIEMLGDPSLMDVSMQQLGQGFGEVIINDRNQVPLDDLKAIVAREPAVKSVAIFYGAGHMPDLEKQLRAAGYVPADDGERWLGAIKVDLTQSAVSPAEINRIRAMMKQMIRQQMRGGK